MSVSKFHQSSQWTKARKAHIARLCYYCKKPTDDVTVDHCLPVSRYPMARLWRSNLVIACGSCNSSKSNKLRLNLKTIKLLGIYYMITILKTIVIALVLLLFGYVLFRYYYLDVNGNYSTITNQIKAEMTDGFYWACSLFDSKGD